MLALSGAAAFAVAFGRSTSDGAASGRTGAFGRAAVPPNPASFGNDICWTPTPEESETAPLPRGALYPPTGFKIKMILKDHK